jgi:exosortase A
MTAAFPFPAAAPRWSAWQTHLAALALVAAAILALFQRDAIHIVSIWWNDATFNHCLLIAPLIGWLVWQRVPELTRLRPAAWAPALALVAVGAAAWLLGEAGGVALARHAGLVAMLQGAAVACLGKSVSRALAFPIFYALFLIPLGRELVPPLQTFTADMAMALLGLSGVPAHIEGVFITTPSGYFEVAEACAGVRFLVAMVALAALVANLCFRSWPRRLAFLAVAVIVPILANGVRAWGTIYIAHLSSIEFASGFDHVFYGWIFFAIVIALVLAAAWPFFDRAPGEPWFDPAALANGRGSPITPVAAAVLALAALPLAWSAAVASASTAPLPPTMAMPDVQGWQRLPANGRWRPRFDGADRFEIARYRDPEGREVDLAVAVFADQSEGREPVGFGQGEAEGWAWTVDAAAPPGGRAERIASHGVAREVATFYRVGDILTGSGTEVKLETMKTRLFGGPRRAVAVLVSAQAPAAGTSPRPAIDAFLGALGPVDRLADRAAGVE